ncbi:AAA family ATPase [soil metagenome]
MNLPIGYDNFGSIIEKKLHFVDKSLFIKEVLLDAPQVTVITRPRRFGKTLNLSMLRYFLSDQILGKPTKDLFNGLKIQEEQELCLQHQGKYPVIFVTLKEIKDGRFEIAYKRLKTLMSNLYSEHAELLSSEKLSAQQKKIYNLIVAREADEIDLSDAFKNLCHYLFLHHGVKPWLLIDEYDTPLQSSYTHQYYGQMIELIRGLFSAALKGNEFLDRAVITGILRVFSKESIFSGVNNLKVYSLLHSQYSQYFGFTEAEVKELLVMAKLEPLLNDIRSWYNGYLFGDTLVYNPWSIINCIQDEGKLIPYWVNTSGEQLIREIIIGSREEFKTGFEALLRGETIERLINENMVFGDLRKNEMAAWSLLLMAGYLKVVAQQDTERGLICTLDIPNREIRRLYGQIIEQWLANGHGLTWYSEFVERLLTGKLDLFEYDLKRILQETISYNDTAKDPEIFYHGFMMGLTISVHYDSRYELSSNRESGYGRYDYLIFSKDKDRPSVLLEFKRVDAVKNLEKLEEALNQAASDALTQIDNQGYVAEAKQRGANQILKVGLAFCDKRFVMMHTLEVC